MACFGMAYSDPLSNKGTDSRARLLGLYCTLALLTHKVFSEHLLCARHHAEAWDIAGEENKTKDLCPHDLAYCLKPIDCFSKAQNTSPLCPLLPCP